MIRAEGIVYPAGGSVLSGVQLRVREGEIHGIYGENGSGKTLLLEILATLRRPDAGVLTLMGRDALRRPEEVRQAIGYVPEGVDPVEGITVGEYLSLFAWCYGPDRAFLKKRREDVVERMDLNGVLKSPMAGLSHGILRRVAFSRSVLHDPRILIVDEPFAGLDDPWKERIARFLKDLREDGAAIVGSVVSRTDLQGGAPWTRVEMLKEGELTACP
jgi:ABC-2 type transport system ATP-binding protein